MKPLTQDTLLDLISYDPLTGKFRWKKKRRGISTEKDLGCCNGFGYLRITVCGQSYYAHRLAWLYMYGYFPKNEIDHINGDKSDNRIENLREATGAQNVQNKLKAQKNSNSGHLGISWHAKGNKWQVHICVCRKRKYLGLYDTIEEAKKVYLEAKKELHPFANI